MKGTQQILFSEDGSLDVQRAIVCSEDAQVSCTGARVLASGGNAVDAVVAGAFAASVVNAHRFSLAGAGGLLLVWMEKKGRAYAVDFPPVAPVAAKPGLIQQLSSGAAKGDSHLIGAHAATVPAVMAGLARALEQFGTLTLKQAICPAIELASGGFKVSPSLAQATKQPHLSKFPETTRCYLPRNRPLRPGSNMPLAGQADLLKKVSEGGTDVFYRGEVARKMVEHLRSVGGFLTLEDLGGYHPRVYPASRGDLHDVLMFGGPASTSGSPLLFLTLNILEGLSLKPISCRSTEAVHWVLEAAKLAWEEHRKTIGHTGKSIHPFEWMLAKSLAVKLRSKIDLNRAALQGPSYRTPLDLYPDASSHIAAVDADGNMAVVSQTLGTGVFGCGLTIPGTGMVMNNGMAFFDLRQGRPYSLEPGKRARILLGSTLVLKKGRPFIAIGATGGAAAVAPMAHLLIDIVEHDQDLAQAIASPRLFCEERGNVVVERTLPPTVRRGLKNMGHVIELARQDRSFPGPVLGIHVDPDERSRTGCVDPRRPGGALAGF